MKFKADDRVEVCNAYLAHEKLNGMTGRVVATCTYGESAFVVLDNGRCIWFLNEELRPISLSKAHVLKDISRKVSLTDVLKLR